MVIYGYKIVNGMAEVDFQQATNLRQMFSLYLKGLSIRDAAREAGIEKSACHCGKYLADSRYMGDEFYPQIIDEETYNQVQAERQRRNHRTTGKRAYRYHTIVVQDRFKWNIAPNDRKIMLELTGAKRAAFLYDHIDGEVGKYCDALFTREIPKEIESIIYNHILEKNR